MSISKAQLNVGFTVRFGPTDQTQVGIELSNASLAAILQ